MSLEAIDPLYRLVPSKKPLFLYAAVKNHFGPGDITGALKRVVGLGYNL